ncbi:MAG: hypothetical protein JW874_13350 [Spirochaetales bacterium]|nr:hypothetical protein [Spirochaetales bacterium]
MSNDIFIKEASTRKDINAFIKFPWIIYRKQNKYPNWVPPLIIDKKSQLNKSKNPFFKHANMQLFLAYKDGKPAGRIAATVDKIYLDFQKKKDGFFGFFECIDDVAVAKALLEKAQHWVKSRGCTKIIGPMNPSTGSSLGLLADSYDLPPVVEMEYNPAYYLTLLEKAGYAKEKDLFCYKMDTRLKLSEKMVRVSELVKKRLGIEVRKINFKELEKDLPVLRDIYNDAWKDNWGFAPWTEEEFEHLAADLKMIANPDLVLIVELEGKPVGFTIPLPDANEILVKMNGRLFPTGLFRLLAGLKKIKMLRVAILGIKGEYHNKGIDALLIKEIYERGEKAGFQGAELSWILEDNHALNNLLNTWGAERYRTYRVFSRNLK